MNKFTLLLTIINRHGLRELTWLERNWGQLVNISLVVIAFSVVYILAVILDYKAKKKEWEK